VITPGGSPGIYGTIHFHHLAIGIIPLDDQGNTWLVGQWRYPLGLYSWEIPEGGGDPDLPALESAKRELKEETGIEAASWQLILEMHLSNSVTDEHCFVYLATGLSFGESSPDETERVGSPPALEDAYQRVLRGEITDAISVAAILRLKLLLGEGTAFRRRSINVVTQTRSCPNLPMGLIRLVRSTRPQMPARRTHKRNSHQTSTQIPLP
jgi:8-oxo-dGTP pyrophosphatase MutT (NUDIX family)